MRDELYGLVRSYIEKCNRCGDCRAVCPVFAEEPVEMAVARGKLLLAGRLLAGEIEPTPALLERLDKCLLCQACTFRCAFHLRVDRVVMAARAALAEAGRLPAAKRAVFSLLGDHAGAMQLLCMAGAATAPLWGRRIPTDSGLRLRFPMGGSLDGDRVVPRPAARPFRGRVPASVEVDQPKGRVAFFTGCYVNYIAPSIGMDGLELLRRAGVSVLIAQNQQCCGLPMVASGDFPTALKLMKANLEALSATEADAVVLACATCGTALRDIYPEMLAKLGPSLEEEARRLADRSYDLSEFLAEVAPLPDLPALKEKLTVTYHDSCHLARGLGIRSQPRKLLRGIGNLELVEMEASDSCCGGAGAFGFTQRELSKRIGRRKTEHIAATGASLVVSGCHGCNLQITEGLVREGSGAQAVHLAELLARAYRA
ncbi:MAG: (Fe-S)-binding protein [Chloroflexota bacterium]